MKATLKTIISKKNQQSYRLLQVTLESFNDFTGLSENKRYTGFLTPNSFGAESAVLKLDSDYEDWKKSQLKS